MKSKLRKCHGCKVRYDCKKLSSKGLPDHICIKCKYEDMFCDCSDYRDIRNWKQLKCKFTKKVSR